MSDKQVVGVVSKNSIAYVAAIFECYTNNEVVVLLRDKDDKRRELTDVSRVIEPVEKSGWFTVAHEFRTDDSLAQIAFTSGTEGEPKGVLLTHQALSDVTSRLNQIMEVDASIREYVGIPANFSFGLGRFRAVAAAGGHAFLPANGFDPLEIRDMLKEEAINAISAVPSLWRVLLKNKHIFSDERENVRWIEIGSQYMSRAEKEELVSLFPRAIIAQHYGLTEASRTSFLRLDQIKGEHLESVGQAYGNTQLKISDAGHICIKGPHVAKTLLKNGDYVSNLDEDGWFHTSDLGRLEDQFLYYQGRADDLINCGGVKLSPDALERELRERLRIKEGIAIAAVDDELTGHAVLVAYREDSEADASKLAAVSHEVLTAYGVNNRKAIKLMKVSEFPLTSTNKVKRKELSKTYLASSEQTEKARKSDFVQSYQLTENERLVAEVWADVLKLDFVDPDQNFYDLGGDSLSAIGALVSMESRGVSSDISKGMLQGMTIREIAARMSGSNSGEASRHSIRSLSIKNTMTVSIVRGLMVLLVIFAHWHQGFLERIPGFNVDMFTSLAGPILALGTPGFAIMYGVGAGYSLYPLFERDRARLKGVFSKTAKLLAMGIVVMAVVGIGAKLSTQSSITYTDITNSFFSVLTYYLLISVTLFYWFKLIHKSQNKIVFTLFLASVSYALHMILSSQLGGLTAYGLIEFVKLLFTAKYGYFLMLSGTLLGLAIGMVLDRLADEKRSLDVFYLVGLTLFTIGSVLWSYNILIDPVTNWPTQTTFLWRWLVYAGAVLLMLGFTSRLLDNYDNVSGFQQALLQGLSIIGMLAFPLFVLHELVMPVKAILVTAGVQDALALILPMMAFLALSAVIFRKVHNFSFQ